jgi:hypothetical protein
MDFGNQIRKGPSGGQPGRGRVAVRSRCGGGGFDDRGASARGGEAGRVGCDVVDGAGLDLARVDHDVTDERAVKEVLRPRFLSASVGPVMVAPRSAYLSPTWILAGFALSTGDDGWFNVARHKWGVRGIAV